MAEVVYRGEWPDDVKATVEFYVKRYACLLPGWCRIFYVRFDNSEEIRAAEISVHVEGRFATMRITPEWLEELPDDRARAIIHEIVHIHVQPMRTVFVDLVEDLDENFNKFAWERWKESWEGSVEDLAWAFHSILKEEQAFGFTREMVEYVNGPPGEWTMERANRVKRQLAENLDALLPPENP